MSFFFAIFYLIAEYMRPQSMYDAIANLQLARIVIICIIISFLLEGRKLNNRSFQNILILSYLAWFLVASMFSFVPEVALQALANFSKYVVIYFLLTNIINERRKLYVFLIIFLLLNFKIAQFAVRVWAASGFHTSPRGFHQGGGIGAGFFQNPNDFAVALNSMFGISLYMVSYDAKKIFSWFRMRWFHLAAVIIIPLAVLASSSRGAAIGFFGTMLGLLYKTKRKVLVLIVVVIMTGGFIALIPPDNMTRFLAIGTEEDGSSQSRLELWRAGIRMANDFPLTGVGPDNFIFANKNLYGSDRAVVEHNIFIQAMSELGYPGLVLFLMMVIGCFYNQNRARKLLKERNVDDRFLYGLSHGLDLALLGFLVNGFFITVLYYPFFWMLLSLNVALLNVVKKIKPEPDTAKGGMNRQ